MNTFFGDIEINETLSNYFRYCPLYPNEHVIGYVLIMLNPKNIISFLGTNQYIRHSDDRSNVTSILCYTNQRFIFVTPNIGNMGSIYSDNTTPVPNLSFFFFNNEIKYIEKKFSLTSERYIIHTYNNGNLNLLINKNIKDIKLQYGYYDILFNTIFNKYYFKDARHN